MAANRRSIRMEIGASHDRRSEPRLQAGVQRVRAARRQLRRVARRQLARRLRLLRLLLKSQIAVVMENVLTELLSAGNSPLLELPQIHAVRLNVLNTTEPRY